MAQDGIKGLEMLAEMQEYVDYFAETAQKAADEMLVTKDTDDKLKAEIRAIGVTAATCFATLYVGIKQQAAQINKMAAQIGELTERLKKQEERGLVEIHFGDSSQAAQGGEKEEDCPACKGTKRIVCTTREGRREHGEIVEVEVPCRSCSAKETPMTLREFIEHRMQVLRDEGYKTVICEGTAEVEIEQREEGATTSEMFTATEGDMLKPVQMFVVGELKPGTYRGVKITYVVVPKGMRKERYMSEVAIYVGEETTCTEGEGP